MSFSLPTAWITAVNRDDCVGIENGMVEISAEKETDVADYKFVGHG